MKKKILKITGIVLALPVIFVLYLVINTLIYYSGASEGVDTVEVEVRDIRPEAIANFQELIRIKTVSYENKGQIDYKEFAKFDVFIKERYPLFYTQSEKQVFGGHSYLYGFKGSDSNLKPIILMAHYDVVPVPPFNLSKWNADPFGGEIIDGEIYGRGAIDMKQQVISILEGIEYFLANGIELKRPIYVVFGHDEEIGGNEGAKVVAAYLEEQGVKAEFVLDEGGFIYKVLEQIPEGFACVGVGEKGIVTLELSVELPGGHSSMPMDETAIDVLAAAVARVKQNPFPTEISPVIEELFDLVGSRMPFVAKVFFANKQLFKSFLSRIMGSNSPTTNAFLRTTTAPTVFTAGEKQNVIPNLAKAYINFRILPGTSTDEVLARVKEVVNDDRIKIIKSGSLAETIPFSPTDSYGYHTILNTSQQVRPQPVYIPCLVIAATDSRYFHNISPNIYKFIPYTMTVATRNIFHNVNERIAVSDLNYTINFMIKLIENSSK